MDSPSKPLPLATTDPVTAMVVPPEGEPGLVLAGRYRLLAEIGRGGMGAVWKSERIGWDSPVAVKLPILTETPGERERFLKEVRIAAGVRSQHVVQVLDHGVDRQSNLPFIAMELLEGESLSGRLRRLKTLSPNEVLTIVEHVGRALARMHERDRPILHRDLKPDNIFLVAEGDSFVAKVLDFGIATDAAVARNNTKAVTVPGRPVGTAFYMSPEQSTGATTDHRSDLWSLAVIAFECLTGKQPFGAPDVPTLIHLLWSEQRPVPSRRGHVPPGFDEWFAKGTAIDLDQRFQSANELVAALRPICGASPTSSAPPIAREPIAHSNASTAAPVMHTGPVRLQRRTSAQWVGVGVILGFTAGGALFLPRLLGSSAPKRAATPGIVAPSAPPAAGSAETAMTARSPVIASVVEAPPPSAESALNRAPTTTDNVSLGAASNDGAIANAPASADAAPASTAVKPASKKSRKSPRRAAPSTPSAERPVTAQPQHGRTILRDL